MRKQVLFLKSLIPYSWWIAILTSVGYVRLRLGRFEGIRHSWIWDNEDGIDRLFALVTIHSPELELISKKKFFFKLEQLDEVKPR